MRRGQAKGQLSQPIARWEPTPDGEVLLMDTLALTLHLGISDRTVRRYPQHRVKTDPATGAPLYDAGAIGDARATTRTRRTKSKGLAA